MADAILKEGERLDKTGFGDYAVIQGQGFSYGVDTVLITAYAKGETGASPIPAHSKVLDIGTGNGIIPFILYHKDDTLDITGVELQSESYDRAVRGAKVNGLEGKMRFINADILDYAKECEPRTYDAIITNPPYFKRGATMISGDNAKMVARHETTATLDDIARVAGKLLVTNGNFYMVHRPDRIVSVLSSMRNHGIEPKCLQMVAPREGEAANIMLVYGIKGAGEELKMLSEIHVHEGDGYSGIIERIYERE